MSVTVVYAATNEATRQLSYKAKYYQRLTNNFHTRVAAFRVTPRETKAWTRSSRAVKDLAVLPPPALVRVSSALISLQTVTFYVYQYEYEQDI